MDDYSTITTWPAFREKRENELKIDYTSAYAGIGGARKPVWKGLERDDKKDVKIIPFTLGFEADKDFIYVKLDFLRGYLKLKNSSYKKIYSFLKKRSKQIFTIANFFKCSTNFNIDYSLTDSFASILQKIKHFYNSVLQIEIYDSTRKPNNKDLRFKILQFVGLYPIYDSLIRISLGEKEHFLELVEKLDAFLQKFDETEAEPETSRKQLSETQIKQINKSVDGINVKAGIRWQVFERDDFKCVACGASALDGAILHVDHILPRSKGGKDELSNFQTLCHLCNIGKSNKSERNLRERNNL